MPPVRVDAVQVQRILVNLLDNALKFSPPGSPVTVRVTRTRKEVIVRVTDQGRGVPESELEHVFEPFYRGAPAQDQTGTGLGLAIARGFAEANGGRLWAESRPGQGAVVRARAAAGRGGARVSLGAILVVDDEPQILRALTTNLRGAGYEVCGRRPPSRRWPRRRCGSRTRSCSTWCCPTARAWTSAASCAPGAEVPIVILSAVGEEEQKVRRSTPARTTT